MSRIGILIINTGTPDEPSVDAIRVYLREMLLDPALVSAPRFIWKRVLEWCILPKRPARTLPSYQKVWTPQGPRFMLISQAQRDALEAELAARGFADGDFEVALAMRYGNPSIGDGLARLREDGCNHVVVLPLYPQYVRVCTGTCITEFQRCVEEMRADGWDVETQVVESFFDQPAYREGVVDSVRRAWAYEPGAKLCVSLHSTLVADVEDGDPYRDQCEQTARDLAADLGIACEDWVLSYQSRFDSRKWLQPLTPTTLDAWAAQGVNDVCVVCPGFTADNIETLVEVNKTLRKRFLAAAQPGAHFTYVPALNDSPYLIRALADAIASQVKS